MRLNPRGGFLDVSIWIHIGCSPSFSACGTRKMAEATIPFSLIAGGQPIAAHHSPFPSFHACPHRGPPASRRKSSFSHPKAFRIPFSKGTKVFSHISKMLWSFIHGLGRKDEIRWPLQRFCFMIFEINEIKRSI